MKRYKLRQGKLRPDDSGEWVRVDEVQAIFTKLIETPTRQGWADAESEWQKVVKQATELAADAAEGEEVTG